MSMPTVPPPPPSPVDAGINKSLSASGSSKFGNPPTNTPKCYICSKTVYKMEEMIAVGKTWHTDCFCCGGMNNIKANNSTDTTLTSIVGCKKILKRDNYVDRNGEPYCTTCYNKLFRPKGFGYSNTLNTDYGPIVNDNVDSNSTCEVNDTGTTASVTSSVATETKPVAPLAPKSPPTQAASAAGVFPKASSIAAKFEKQASVSSPPNNTGTTTPAKSLTKQNSINKMTASAPKCTSCTKTVYKVEEMIAVGRLWHTTCFCCGGTKGNGCNKVLKRDNYVDHENQPYCNSCYGKLYRPKGFGYSNTLNTDYGVSNSTRADEANKNDNTEQVTDNLAQLSMTEEEKREATIGTGSHGYTGTNEMFQSVNDILRKNSINKSSSADAQDIPMSFPPAAPPANPKEPVMNPGVPTIQTLKVKGGSANIKIGNGGLHGEATYVGDNDEVDESEW